MPRTQEGSKFVTHLTALDSTSDTDVYVVPKNFSSHVKNLMINNTNAANKNYTLKIYEKLTNLTHTLFSAHPVTAKDFENVFTNTLPLFLHAEDKIIVAAETADTLTILVATEEFFDPVR
jgi:Tat protein secretion system quality control protein TatD with DNase activity